MKDYEQLYYDLLCKYKKALKKIEELEQELETLSNYKDVKTKKLLLESLIKFKRSKR